MRFMVLAGLLVSTPALALECPAAADWAKAVAHRAARAPAMKFALKPGEIFRLTLSPSAGVKLVAPSERVAKPGTMAGLAAIDIPTAGKLSIALSNKTYVDLVRDGQVIKSASFGNPPDCATAHKVVVFDVTPGRYFIQLTGSPELVVTMQTVLNGTSLR